MSWYRGELTTLAFLWRLVRSDGVALGFTSHDRDLVRDRFVYRATPGMRPSAIRWSDGFAVDDLDVEGALTSDAITEADLRGGRWDGARLRLSAVDWADTAAAPIILLEATLGAVSVRDGAFSVALRGPSAVFDKSFCEEISPSCRATLGDQRCRVDLAALTCEARVVAASDATVTLATAMASDAMFDFGRLRWLEGANAGIASRVLASAGTLLTLAEPPPMPLVLPVAVELIEGCDRQLATCRTRFANIANFQGEPWLPGNDLLTRYGG